MTKDTTGLQEAAFLSGYDPSDFERPSVAVDVVVMSASGGVLTVLLGQRTAHPGLGRWALPGGFVRMDETLEDAVTRLLASKVGPGLSDVKPRQLYTFGAVERDPRMRIITVAHYVLLAPARMHQITAANPELVAATLDVPWSGIDAAPVRASGPEGELAIAFDHADILGVAVARLRGRLDYTPIAFDLLPPAFTLRALQAVHETVLGRALNKDSFRRSAARRVVATGQRETVSGHRPARLYRPADSQ